MEKKCIDCGCSLTENNWCKSSRYNYWNICNDCRNKRQKERRDNYPIDKTKRNNYEKQLRTQNPEYAERQRENRRNWGIENPLKVVLSQFNYRERRKLDPELIVKDRRNQRNNAFKRKYGITIEYYEKIYNQQEGKCLICERFFKVLDVDHNHETGEIRGLLCRACNTLVGQLECRKKEINKIINYLNSAQYLQKNCQ
jgi:hypothetical protein